MIKALPSFDSFSMGITILNMVDKEFDYTLKKVRLNVFPGQLNEAERTTFFSLLIKNAKKNEEKLSNKEVKQKIQLIELAETLTKINPIVRISCKQAAEKIENIFKNIIDTSAPAV